MPLRPPCMKSIFSAFLSLPLMALVLSAEPIRVVFDTDMGNDVDDAIALSMLINKHKSEDIKLGDYDLIGFASGIYMGKLHGKLIRFIKTNQSKLKNIFLV